MSNRNIGITYSSIFKIVSFVNVQIGKAQVRPQPLQMKNNTAEYLQPRAGKYALWLVQA